MEAFFSQFSLLSNQALQDKNFDPSTIEDLMKFFEVEAYNSWATMEYDLNKEVKDAEKSMKEAEKYLNSAMEEFRLFEVEFDRNAKVEFDSLNHVANSAKKMGNSLESSTTKASKKYMEAALNSATATMKSAWKEKSSNSATATMKSAWKEKSSNSPKVHPS